ncbi:Protein unc-79 [Cichlidogyrus casuarinus]|uniref:Protein unc-79 n=1 Tax=Cichlidogyrus casuarinus TaxID=1844966 RepID=A0ABD2Q1V8_9PLAT
MQKRLQKCMEFEPPEVQDRLLMTFSQELQNLDSANEQTRLAQNLKLQSLLACSGNALAGCSCPNSITGPKCIDMAFGVTHCLGHSFTSVSRAYLGGVDLPSINSDADPGRATPCHGICANIGEANDLLSSRFLTWLRKQIFITGKNEDQHSTASSIFIK